MLVLSGIAVIVAGFLLRWNPLVVTIAAAAVTGLAVGLDPITIVKTFGKAFNDTRYISIVWIVLPVVGILERHGLQERARSIIVSFAQATAGRLLIAYLLLRQGFAALGLVSVMGHAQTVRPLVAPMAEAAAEKLSGQLENGERQKIKAMAAATDNVGLFFGEDMFLAIGSILLIKGVLEQYGIILTPFSLSIWAIPTAVAAFVIHGLRLWMFDRRLCKGNVS